MGNRIGEFWSTLKLPSVNDLLSVAAVSGSQNLGPTSRQSSLQRRSSHQGTARTIHFLQPLHA